MNPVYVSLRSVCSALFACNFNSIDRLKAILQVTFEFLAADSVTAYRYDRVTQGLEIIGMPGVVQREVMRGPTPELVFQWEGENLAGSQLPEPVWLETGQDYDDYIMSLKGTGDTPNRSPSASDFRRRQLGKYPTGTDLSTAKICLLKGIGQTEDRVGMLFFNFPKPPHSSSDTFGEDLRSAIIYIATLVRELLVDELYHTQKRSIDAGTLLRDALNLLRTTEEHALRLVPMTATPGRINLPEEYLAIAETRKVLLRSRLDGIDDGKIYRELLVKRLELLDELTGIGKQPSCSSSDSILEINAIAAEVQLSQICSYVCRAALGTCETFGGQADIVFVLGGNIGRRIASQEEVVTSSCCG
ncbi:hypothetical protein ACFL6U_16240 [Planctomycetota bacterium]